MVIIFLLLFVVLADVPHSASFPSDSYFIEFFSEIDCPFPDAQVKRSTISVNPIVVRSYHENGDSTNSWQLFYNITWESTDSSVDFQYKVQLQQRTSKNPLTVWNLYLCGENPSNSHDVSHPFYLVEAMFTHEALFQVVPVIEDGLASDRVTFVKFDTPDCYESTKDREFCATQSVLYSGAPADVRLIDVTKYVTDGVIVPSFEWLDPVQVNLQARMVLYMVTVKTENDEIMIFDIIYHDDDVEAYTWEAVADSNDEKALQENLNYKITITPYISTPDLNMEIVPGFDSELLFLTNVTKVVNEVTSDWDAYGF